MNLYLMRRKGDPNYVDYDEYLGFVVAAQFAGEAFKTAQAFCEVEGFRLNNGFAQDVDEWDIKYMGIYGGESKTPFVVLDSFKAG